MAKSLDGQTIRIKGSDVTTKVRYCTEENGQLCAVTEMSCLHANDNSYPGAAQFVSEDNPYADCFPLDQIELRKPDGTWYTPNFRVR